MNTGLWPLNKTVCITFARRVGPVSCLLALPELGDRPAHQLASLRLDRQIGFC